MLLQLISTTLQLSWRRSFRLCLKVIALSFIATICAFPSLLLSQCEHPDYEELMAFYEDANGSNWTLEFGWKEAIIGNACNPCDYNGDPWAGLKCENDRVVEIKFNNSIRGGQIRDLKLDSLKRLIIVSGELEGEMPAFEGLPKLQELNLNFNAISGKLPDFKNNLDLRIIYLKSNLLSGTLNDWIDLQLYFVDLSNNNFEGCVPENLCELQSAVLSGNQLLPWKGDMSFICNEDITQTFTPCNTGEDSTQFYIINENCECVLNDCTPHPDLPGVLELYDALNGPDWKSTAWDLLAADASCDPCKALNNKPAPGLICENERVSEINFDQDSLRLVGQFPNLHLSNLKKISIHNQFIYSIPEFTNLPLLETIEIKSSSLRNPLPSFINCPNLKRINFEDNNLEGSFPDFLNLNNIEDINLSINRYSGTVPDMLPQFPNLKALIISDNTFEGCHPSYACDLIIYDAARNYQMPWLGYTNEYCDGTQSSQVGANCYNLQLRANGTILDNCYCEIDNCDENDLSRIELEKLYDAFGMDDWPQLHGWSSLSDGLTCNPCDHLGKPWHGIECSQDTIIGITIQTVSTNVNNEIPSLNLPHLKRLTIGFLRGPTTIPDFSGTPEIETLMLDCETLSSGFENLAVLTKLKELNLRDNALNADISILASLPLKVINLSNNLFSTDLPDFTSFKNYPTIEVDLSQNRFRGCFGSGVCDLDTFSAMANLSLPWSGNHTYFCDGVDQIGAYCTSTFGDDGNINEECECGIYTCDSTHPDFEGLMEIYDLMGGKDWPFKRGWLDGKEGRSCNPCDYFGEPWLRVECENNRVTKLNLYTMGLTGNIVDFNLSALKDLNLSSNSLIDTVPNFTKMPNLESLNLDRNKLIGSVPNFAHLEKLDHLDLSYNELSGSIPLFSNLPNLIRLILRYNKLTGTVPYFISTCPALEYIYCNNNALIGCIPDFACSDSVYCDFIENDFMPYNGNVNTFCFREEQIGAFCGGDDFLSEGVIQDDCSCLITPCESEHPDFEDMIDLYNQTNGAEWFNNTGWIHASRGVTCDPCQNLGSGLGYWYGVECNEDGRVISIDLDGINDGLANTLTGNNLVGTLPELDLPYLEKLILSWNDLSGEFPDVKRYPNLEVLGLVNNNLTGLMPTFENNNKLHIFRGSFNQLTGRLPDFSNIPDIEVFTVSNNLLSGCFPHKVCSIDLFHAANNFSMPFYGDHTQFCDGNLEIGAPCIVPGTSLEGTIQSNCVCENISSVYEYEIGAIRIVPNPVVNEIEIVFEIETKGFGDIINYEIFDISGKSMQGGNVVMSKINVGLLSSGVYILKLKLPNGNSDLKRFIKL